MDYVQKKLAIPIPTINVIWVLFWEEGGGGGVLGHDFFLEKTLATLIISMS